jgi:tetratricopeptide (TPR) repeat protein
MTNRWRSCGRFAAASVILGILQPQLAKPQVGERPSEVFVGNNLTVGRDLIIGWTKDDIQDAISAVLKNEDRDNLNRLAAETQLSTEAVKEVFRSIVGKEAKDISVQEQLNAILRNWLELKRRLEHVSSDDENVIELRRQALAALNRGNRDEAERLLLDAKSLAIESARTAQTVADKKLRDAADSSVDLAQLSVTNLRFVEAAERYHEAAEIEPAADVEQKCRYLISAGDAALEAGDYDLSTKYLKEGMALAQLEGAKEAVVQAETEHRLGRVALLRGDNSTATGLLSEALTIERLVPQHDKIEEADTLEDVAVTQWNISNFKDASATLQLAADLSGGDDSPRALLIHSEAFNTEGGLLADLGQFDAAEKALLDAFHLRQRLFPDQPFSPRIIDSENNLGFLYRQWGRNSDADNFLKKAEAAARIIYGREHLTLSIILVNRAILDCNIGNIAEALELIDNAQSIRDKKINGANLLTAYSLDVRGMILLRGSRLLEARSAIMSSYQTRVTLLHDPDVSLAKSHLAMSALELKEGNLAQARTEAETALTSILLLLSPSHPLAGLAYRKLGEIASGLHDDASASEYLSKAAQVRFPTSDCDL